MSLLADRFRGVIALIEDKCTSCMLCARECLSWCIHIDSHPETTAAADGGRPRTEAVLDRFAVDWALCMYCGICIEVCPFDALEWAPAHRYAEPAVDALLHERPRLTDWLSGS